MNKKIFVVVTLLVGLSVLTGGHLWLVQCPYYPGNAPLPQKMAECGLHSAVESRNPVLIHWAQSVFVTLTDSPFEVATIAEIEQWLGWIQQSEQSFHAYGFGDPYTGKGNVTYVAFQTGTFQGRIIDYRRMEQDFGDFSVWRTCDRLIPDNVEHVHPCLLRRINWNHENFIRSYTELGLVVHHSER